MALRVRFEQSDAFTAAAADYGLTEARLARLRTNLSRNPILGKPSTDDVGVRRYEFHRQIVSYAIVDREIGKGEVVVWLLDLSPIGQPPSKLSRWGKTALKVAPWLLRIVVIWR